MVLMDQKAGTEKQMKRLFFIAISTALLFPTSSLSDPNHFGAGGVFELDLGDSEIPLTPKQEREQKLLEEQLKTKQNNSSRPN